MHTRSDSPSPVPARAPSRAREEAAAWHARLAGDSATEQDWLGFEQWLQDEHNKAAYDALDQVLLDVDANRDTITASASERPPVSRPVFRRPIFVATTIAMAAAALLALLLRPTPAQELAYATPVNSDQAITLPDATILHLNRNTALRVRFARGARQVILDRGEASFAVTHDPARPFTVAVGNAIVRDIGTEFNVARLGSNFVVTVRRGSVELTPESATPQQLPEGAQATVGASGITRVATVNADDAFAWQSGRLVYHNAPLSAIVDDLSRYSAHPIVLAPDVPELHFSGVLAIEDGSVMLQRLQAFLPIQSAQDGDRIVVRSRT